MGNHQISESCNNTVSRPSGSSSSSPLVKIDSIVIDLTHIAMHKFEEGKCHHTFSIRGYVAGMREKDKKTCLPFATSCDDDDDDSTVSEAQLPPLVVPKFRWWRCENCVKDLVANENARKDIDGGRAPLRGRKRSPFKCRASSDAEKPASNVAAHGQTLGQGDEPKAASCSNASLSQRADEVNSESGVANAQHVDQVEPERARNKEIISSGEGLLKIICSNQDNSSQEAHKNDESERVVNEKEKLSDDDRDGSFSLPRESPLATNTREEGVDNSLGEPGIEGSSESDGETGKAARFRLLTDLLSGETNPENTTTSTNSAQASLGQNPVAYSDAGTADLEKGHRKRKVPQEPDSKVSEVGSRVTIVKKAAIDIIPDPQPNPARQTKRRAEKEPGVVKKRSKLTHVDGGCSSIVPLPTTPVGSGDLNINEGTLVEQNPKALQPPMEGSKKSFSSINNNRFSETGYLPTWMGESSVKRKNAEPWLHSPVGNYEMPRAVSGKVGLDLSLDSFRDPKARSVEIEFDQSGNLKKGDKTSDHKRKKGTLIRDESDTVKADWPSLKGGLLCDLNAQTTIPFNGKQKNPAVVEERSLPLHKKTDYSFQKNEVKEFRRSTDASSKAKKGQRRDEKSSDQGPPDDIPMEIVELMAQNQYERGLSEKPDQAINSNGCANGYPSPNGYGNSFTAWKSPPLNYFHRETVEETRLKLSGALPLINQAKKVPNGGSRNGFQLGEGVNPMWLGPTTTNPTFGFPNSSPSQSRNKEMGAPVHKGKTISDIKVNEVRKQSESHNLFFSKPQDYEKGHYGTYGKNLGRPLLDSYPNEAIPALQLLSLMDRNVSSSNRAFNLEKPLAPCDYHPSLSREMTHNFLDRSLFSSHQHPKLFSDLRPGVSNPGEGSRQSLPLAHHQLCFKSQEQEKSRSSYASSLLGVSKYQQNPASLSSSRDTVHGSFPVREMQRGQLTTLPPPITFPFQGHMLETRNKYFDFGRGNVHGTVWPSKSMPESHVCSLNQNPADFSIPEAGNAYTISWKDLKFGNRGFMRSGNVIRRRRPKITRGRMVKDAPQYVNL